MKKCTKTLKKKLTKRRRTRRISTRRISTRVKKGGGLFDFIFGKKPQGTVAEKYVGYFTDVGPPVSGNGVSNNSTPADIAAQFQLQLQSQKPQKLTQSEELNKKLNKLLYQFSIPPLGLHELSKITDKEKKRKMLALETARVLEREYNVQLDSRTIKQIFEEPLSSLKKVIADIKPGIRAFL
jgi:hypothetical protein